MGSVLVAATALACQGQRAPAGERQTTLHALEPRLQEARLWIARAYLQLGEKSHARAELDVLARNPLGKHHAAEIRKLLDECKK